MIVGSLSLLLATQLVLPASAGRTQPSNSASICEEIQRVVSRKSDVYFPGQPEYTQDLSHFAVSSAQQSECTVRPGTASDLSDIIKIIGAARKPFAVKGGGHAMNPGFSSTPGVHIAMSRFSEVKYNRKDGTAIVGAGLKWEEVYAALDPYGINVVGGRVRNVGVAGFTLGGGYGWTTNQHGLAVDNVVAYELVRPDGRIVTVTSRSEPELFFGLKGGMNNFGIVTKFTFKTHKQDKVWGGAAMYANPVDVKKLMDATVEFQNTNKDPKATLLLSIATVQGQILASPQLFYDAPELPVGMFSAFLALQPTQVFSPFGTKKFLDHVNAVPTEQSAGLRGVFDGIPTPDYTQNLMDRLFNETQQLVTVQPQGALVFMSFLNIEPFTDSAWTHGNGAAYPPDASRRRNLKPTNLFFSYAADPSLSAEALTSLDNSVYDMTRKYSDLFVEVAEAEGQKLRGAPNYPNYAIFDTPLAELYGEQGVRKLKALKKKVDPQNVMGLAGGFKL